MKVVHLSTSVSGASANTRLHKSLIKLGIDSTILVQGQSPDVKKVQYADTNRRRRWAERTIGRMLRILIRRWYGLTQDMPFSHGETGIDVSNYAVIQEADVIHLHWICNYQSIRTIRRLIETGKPIVWTCHDSWPFTGGCHVRYGCNRFTEKCGKCPILQSGRQHDITSYILAHKKREWKNNQIAFIAPSRWMKDNIKKSSLFSNNACKVIPNAVDLQTFRKMSDLELDQITGYKKDKRKLHLLFGAEAVKSPYKGFGYVLDVLEQLKKENPELAEKTVLHIIGAGKCDEVILQQYECEYWGFIRNEIKMAAIYNLADIYLYPSIDDNLPNMIMESLSCETPVVAFDTGGITDMVEHKKNGYVASYKNSQELKEGILWVYRNNQNNCLGEQGRRKTTELYNFDTIAHEHIKFYEELLGSKGERM